MNCVLSVLILFKIFKIIFSGTRLCFAINLCINNKLFAGFQWTRHGASFRMCVRPHWDLRWARWEGAQPWTLLWLQETSSSHVDREQDVHSLLLWQLGAEERIRGLAYCRCVEYYTQHSQPWLKNEPPILLERNHIKVQIRVFGESVLFFRLFELTLIIRVIEVEEAKTSLIAILLWGFSQLLLSITKLS